MLLLLLLLPPFVFGAVVERLENVGLKGAFARCQVEPSRRIVPRVGRRCVWWEITTICGGVHGEC